MLSRRQTIPLLIFLLALLVRLAAIGGLRDWHHGPEHEFGADGIEFNALALQVAHGGGFGYKAGHPTSFRAPGFPFVLAGVYALLGENYPAAYFSFALMGALGCLLVYLLVRELAEEETARLAGALSVFYIPHIYLATVFASESLFIVCLGAGLWWFVRHLKSGSLPTLAGAGLALGYGALTRPFALLLLPLLCLVLIQNAKGKIQDGGFKNAPSRPPRKSIILNFAFCILNSLRPIAVLILAFVAVLAPWTARNQFVHKHLVLVATNGGSTFYGSNNSTVLEGSCRGGWISTVHLPGRDLIDAAPDEYTHDQVEWRLGKTWVATHLSSLPRLELYKFARLWLPDIDSGNRKYVLLQVAGYTPFLLLFLLGWLRCLREGACWSPGWLALHATMLATVLTALIFWGSPRFRDATLAPLMAYAGLGAQQALAWLRQRRTASVSPAC